MKAEKLRELDETALHQQHGEMNEQIFRLRFQLAMGQADGLKKYHVLRKDRARLLGVLRERQAGAKPAKES